MKVFGVTIKDSTPRSHIGTLSVAALLAIMVVGTVCLLEFLIVMLGLSQALPAEMMRMAETVLAFYLGRASIKPEDGKQTEAKTETPKP